jgi:hypothetical protein
MKTIKTKRTYWRILKRGEAIKPGDEWFDDFKHRWKKTTAVSWRWPVMTYSAKFRRLEEE